MLDAKKIKTIQDHLYISYNMVSKFVNSELYSTQEPNQIQMGSRSNISYSTFVAIKDITAGLMIQEGWDQLDQVKFTSSELGTIYNWALFCSTVPYLEYHSRELVKVLTSKT